LEKATKAEVVAILSFHSFQLNDSTTQHHYSKHFHTLLMPGFLPGMKICLPFTVFTVWNVINLEKLMENYCNIKAWGNDYGWRY